jgi:hypothetical protein
MWMWAVRLGAIVASQPRSQTIVPFMLAFRVAVLHLKLRRRSWFKYSPPSSSLSLRPRRFLMRMQLWLVGMLVLLHSTDAAWSAARICRYLAPWLLPGAPHQGFPPSVEKFMLGLQQAQESSAASAPFVKHDGPLMMGTFLRRVACAHLAIFMQTTVALGGCAGCLRTVFVCDV